MIGILCLLQTVSAQVFNRSAVLIPRHAAVFANPMFVNYTTNDDAGLMLRAAYGLDKGYEVDLFWVPGLDNTYVGSSVKRIIFAKNFLISAAAGLHYFGDFGLDGRLTLSKTFNRIVTLYSGLDSDFVFKTVTRFDPATDRNKDETDPTLRAWFFIGTETFLTKRLSLLAEGNLGITSDAYNLFGLGLGFYFQP